MGLAITVWRRRDAVGSIPVSLVLVGAAWWSLMDAVAVAASEPETQLLFEQLALPGRVLVPFSWFLSALEFTRHERVLRRPGSYLLWIIPAITVFLGWTSGTHGLLWREVTVVSSGPITLLDLQPALWYWIYTAYAYVVVLGGVILLLRAYIKAPQLYRAQAVWLIAAAQAKQATRYFNPPVGQFDLLDRKQGDAMYLIGYEYAGERIAEWQREGTLVNLGIPTNQMGNRE